VLEARLRGRGIEDEDSVRTMLGRARAELEYADTGVRDKVIVNDDLEKTFRELKGLIFGP
jgi:guanylate kinase